MAKVKLSVTEHGTFAVGGFMGTPPKQIDADLWKLARYVVFKTVVLDGFNKTLVKTVSIDTSNDISLSEKAYLKLVEFLPYYQKALQMFAAKGVTPNLEDTSEGHKTLTIKIKSAL